MSDDDGPTLIRPIPRRPFDLNISSPTPPEEDSAPPSPGAALSGGGSNNNNNNNNNGSGDFYPSSARLLDPRRNGSSPWLADAGGAGGGGSGSGSTSVSRAQSILNLTSSTLFGIYSPTTTGRGLYGDRDDTGTPWGTGAETPAHRLSVDDPHTLELSEDRSSILQRRAAAKSMAAAGPRPSRAAAALSLGGRATLLFTLGMGYGLLVSRLQDEQPNLAALQMEGIANPGYDWWCLAFWGVSGVALGTLLPWLDGMWDQLASPAAQAASSGGDAGAAPAAATKADEPPETDWALVIRGIGAFAGIIFAIRKLPWASTMELSLTLALVNPFLWYLLDRSKSGFLLSAAVGLAGSAVLMGLNPGMMPAPAHHAPAPYRNESSGAGGAASSAGPLVLGGLARKETLETGIWMLSVLFCSCVCFGNIGRRLALGRSPRGRRASQR